MNKKTFLNGLFLLLCMIAGGVNSAWAQEVTTFCSGSGTSGYTLPEGWTVTGSVDGGSYIKFEEGTLTSPEYGPHDNITFTYSVATYGTGTNNPLTIRILSTDGKKIIEKTTATPTSSSYIQTDSPIKLGNIDQNFKIELYGPSGKGVRLRNFSITGEPATIITSSISVTVNESSMGSAEVKGTTIIATPNDGYRVKAGDEGYTVTSGTATVENNGDNTFKVTPETDCIIQINFEAVPAHTVTFSVNGVESEPVDVKEGADIDFPTPDAIDEKVFVGWVTETIDGTTADVPELITQAVMGKDDITYYAVFATATEGDGEVLAQTLMYDTWKITGPVTYTTASAGNYYLCGNGAYVESEPFDLSTLKKVVVYGGTYGGANYNTVKIGDDTNTWKDVTLSGSSQTGTNTFTDEGATSLIGLKPLRVISTCGDGKSNGVRMSKIEIYVKDIAYSEYCTTVITNGLLSAELKVEENISMNAGTTHKIEYSVAEGYDGEITFKSDNEAVTVSEDGILTAEDLAKTPVTITVSASETDTYKKGEATLVVTVTVNPGVDSFNPYDRTFIKVTTTNELEDGEYLIVYEDGKVAFNGSLETLDAVSNTIDVTINDGQIAVDDNTEAAIFTIKTDDENTTIQSASGYYIGQTSNTNGLAVNAETMYTNTITFATDNENKVFANIVSSGGAYLRYNATNGQTRFRYFQSSTYTNQKAIQLYRLQEDKNKPAKLTIGETGWRTLVASKNVKFPDNLEAYIVTAQGDGKATLTKVEAVKADVPVLLNGEPGEYTLKVVEDGECDDTKDNQLKVSKQDTMEAYVLANGNKGVGFYKWTGGWMGAGRVYLPVSEAEARPYIAFDFDNETTGISQTTVNSRKGEIYNLNGQRVQTPVKGGIYIVDGKKMYVK